MELNPNHPVTQMVSENWHKIVALLMQHYGLDTFEITEAALNRLGMSDKSICLDARNNRCVVRLIPAQEAVKLAAKEGGLPV